MVNETKVSVRAAKLKSGIDVRNTAIVEMVTIRVRRIMINVIAIMRDANDGGARGTTTTMTTSE